MSKIRIASTSKSPRSVRIFINDMDVSDLVRTIKLDWSPYEPFEVTLKLFPDQLEIESEAWANLVEAAKEDRLEKEKSGDG